MSAKSKSSKGRTVAAKDAAVKARQLVQGYRIVLEFEDGEWYGHGMELPMVFGEGKTPGQCVRSTRSAMSAAVTAMIENDQTPPIPAGGRRTVQVNVRLTPEEKAMMEATAKQKGFRGLSDFVRAGAIAFAK